MNENIMHASILKTMKKDINHIYQFAIYDVVKFGFSCPLPVFLHSGPAGDGRAAPVAHRGQNVAAIALDRRLLGTIIAVFKMWLCPFN